jgi:pimeloyl-ACP methyl ester carboxylesterase
LPDRSTGCQAEPVPSVDGPRERAVVLEDGRTVGYTEYGDPDGSPLLNCHGGLSCRLDIAPADGAARALGVRIVSPDRPGIGRSTRAKGRSVSDWVADVRGLTERLSIGRFAVFGWSFGGPYAAAVAALLPERTVSATIVAGGVPLDWPCAADGFASRTDAVLFALARRMPPAAWATLRGMGALASRAPHRWMRLASPTLARGDVEAIERDGVDEFTGSIAEGLRRPGGVLDDYRAYGLPWGFAYDSIDVPVHLWQGGDDTLVPVAWSEESARRIPGATLQVVQGAGHFVARDHWEELLAGATQ